MNKLVIFSGKSKSGKSSACTYLESLGYESRAFASILKDMVCMLCDITTEELEEYKDVQRPLSVDFTRLKLPIFEGVVFDRNEFASIRELLQYLGTDIIRKIDSNYTGKQCVSQVADLLASGKNVCISDARFENEVALLEEMQGVKIVKIFLTRTSQQNMNHASEKMEPKADWTVYENNGTLEDLHRFIDGLLEQNC